MIAALFWIAAVLCFVSAGFGRLSKRLSVGGFFGRTAVSMALNAVACALAGQPQGAVLSVVSGVVCAAMWRNSGRGGGGGRGGGTGLRRRTRPHRTPAALSGA